MESLAAGALHLRLAVAVKLQEARRLSIAEQTLAAFWGSPCPLLAPRLLPVTNARSRAALGKH